MKVEVLRLSRWEHPGIFPTFPKGTEVEITGEEDTDFLGWYPCKIKGHESFVPQVFVENGKLNRDYNPTELLVSVGDVLTVKEIIGAWLMVEDKNKKLAWLAAECVKSV